MLVMAYTSLKLIHGATLGAEVATCWPRTKFEQRSNDATSGV